MIMKEAVSDLWNSQPTVAVTAVDENHLYGMNAPCRGGGFRRLARQTSENCDHST
jgi:hypothetical protein